MCALETSLVNNVDLKKQRKGFRLYPRNSIEWGTVIQFIPLSYLYGLPSRYYSLKLRTKYANKSHKSDRYLHKLVF